jgi:two-component system, LytTR family, response regulator AlgR
MKVLICDDEPLARDRLKRIINDMKNYQVVAEAGNGAEAIDMVNKHDPDILLLDVRMPGMDGIEAAHHLSAKDEPPAIIFCTAYDEYALAAFKVDAIGYLMKPVRANDLEEALNKAKRLNKSQIQALNEAAQEQAGRRRSHISAKTHKGIELVPIEDVRYFRADEKYVSVRHSKGELLIDDTLKMLADEFGEQFVRIHRNSLVAVKFIDGMELNNPSHYQIKLKGLDDKLVVSRRHIAALRKVMQKL